MLKSTFPAGRVHPFVRKWRNWQTRKPQELVAARSWRFKSSLPHQHSAAQIESLAANLSRRERCVPAQLFPDSGKLWVNLPLNPHSLSRVETVRPLRRSFSRCGFASWRNSGGQDWQCCRTSCGTGPILRGLQGRLTGRRCSQPARRSQSKPGIPRQDLPLPAARGRGSRQ